MKNIKKFALAVCVFTTALCFSAKADAEVKITIKNNRSHNLSLAFRWAGFDTPDDKRSGWYTVKAGESRTITFEDAVYALTAEDFGYYATGGGKVWQGSADDERPHPVIIHPKKKFSGHPEDPISGGKKVYFRHVSLKETDGSRENGSATLTFNP
jgi:hypothetical protein